MEENQKRGQLLALAMTLPFVIGIPPFVGWWLGSHLDEALDTKPYFTYGLLVFGIMAAIRETYRIIKRIKEDAEDA